MSGLLLVCCDRPEPTNPSGVAEIPTARSTGGGHVWRQPNQSASTGHRKILKTAVDVDSPEAREKEIADVAWNALATDPELACEAFLQLPTGSPERIRLIRHCAMCLAEQNPDKAPAWSATLFRRLGFDSHPPSSREAPDHHYLKHSPRDAVWKRLFGRTPGNYLRTAKP